MNKKDLDAARSRLRARAQQLLNDGTPPEVVAAYIQTEPPQHKTLLERWHDRPLPTTPSLGYRLARRIELWLNLK